ncbi:MAG: hypothetical protein U0934_17760, partial [Pseudotabrizicola sp.]
PVALGEKGFKPSHLLVSQPVEVAHGSVSLRSLNHANNLKSMGLEPRFGGDSWDGFEVPLNEDREIYLLVVRSLDGDVLLREFLEKQEFTFTLDRRLEAGVVGLYSVEVSQVSSVYGIGPKTVCVVEYT